MTKVFTVSLLAISLLTALFLDTALCAPQCLHSAIDVKHAFPGSWPSWTLRQAGHRGTRCWFATWKHGNQNAARRPPPPAMAEASEPRRIKTEAIPMSTLGWTFRSRIAVIGPGEPERDLFAIRYSLFTTSLGRPSVMQQLMDPVGIVP